MQRTCGVTIMLMAAVWVWGAGGEPPGVQRSIRFPGETSNSPTSQDYTGDLYASETKVQTGAPHQRGLSYQSQFHGGKGTQQEFPAAIYSEAYSDKSPEVEQSHPKYTSPSGLQATPYGAARPVGVDTYGGARPSDSSQFQSSPARPHDSSHFQSPPSRPSDSSHFQSSPSRPFDSSHYQSSHSRPSDSMHYQPSPSRPADSLHYQSSPSRPFDSSHFQSPPSRPFDPSHLQYPPYRHRFAYNSRPTPTSARGPQKFIQGHPMQHAGKPAHYKDYSKPGTPAGGVYKYAHVIRHESPHKYIQSNGDESHPSAAPYEAPSAPPSFSDISYNKRGHYGDQTREEVPAKSGSESYQVSESERPHANYQRDEYDYEQPHNYNKGYQSKPQGGRYLEEPYVKYQDKYRVHSDLQTPYVPKRHESPAKKYNLRKYYKKPTDFPSKSQQYSAIPVPDNRYPGVKSGPAYLPTGQYSHNPASEFFLTRERSDPRLAKAPAFYQNGATTSGSDWTPINAPVGAVPAKAYDIPAPDLSRPHSSAERSDLHYQGHQHPSGNSRTTDLFVGKIGKLHKAGNSEEVVSAVVMVKQ